MAEEGVVQGEVVTTQVVADTSVPPGAPPGGTWVEEKYCGPMSWCVGCLLCWCVVCCPFDTRQVYQAPDGKKITKSGASSGQFVDMC
mmetsp:Transcript_6251/g.18491  ORF Transcript_6251/g.18491 Transcript_6251/m.18491 type:complete len:87 (+) Transcript_6251:118-378(+)